MSSIGTRPKSAPSTPKQPAGRSQTSAQGDQASQQQAREHGTPKAAAHQELPAEESLDSFVQAHAAHATELHGAQQGEIWVSTRVTRQAANPESYPLHENDHGLTLSSQNVMVMATGEQGQGGASTDRTGFMVRGVLGSGEHALSGMGGVVQGNTYGEMSVKLSANDSLTIGVLNGTGVHGFGLTGSQTYATHAINEGAFLVGDAVQTAAVSTTRPEDDKVLVTLSDKKWIGLQATVGGSNGAFGGGLRLYATRGKGLKIERWMDRAEASEVLGKQSLWRQKLRSLGLLPQTFVRPDLSDPLTSLRLHDKVSFTKQTTLTGGVAAALGGIYVGLHASVQINQHTVLEKMTDDVVRVTITPKPNRSLVGGVSLDVPLLAAATVTLSQSVGRLFTFDFDLKVPAAKEAYQQALDGRMPSSILLLDPTLVGNNKQAMLTLQQEEKLIDGVKIVALVFGSRKNELTLSAGMTALPNILGDKVGMMGFKMRRGHSAIMAASGDAVLSRDEAVRESSWGFVRRGNTTVSAKVVEDSHEILTGDKVETTNALKLEASFVRDRPNSSTRDDTLAWLNKHFLEDPKTLDEPFKPMSDKYSYGLTVSRILQDEDLEALWREGSVRGVSPATSSPSDEASDESFTPEAREAMVKAIKGAVVREGVPEIARLARALGNPDQLDLTVQSAALTAITEKHLAQSIKFVQPIDENTSLEEIEERMTTAQKHFRRLRVVERDIRDDRIGQTFDEAKTMDALSEVLNAQMVMPSYASLDHLGVEAQSKIRASMTPETRAKYASLVKQADKSATNMDILTRRVSSTASSVRQDKD